MGLSLAPPLVVGGRSLLFPLFKGGLQLPLGFPTKNFSDFFVIVSLFAPFLSQVVRTLVVWERH